MASVLGQLLVELGINTAAFKEGLDKATYQAKQFGTELKSSFSSLGASVKGLGDAFAGLDPAIGGALSGISNAMGPLVGSLGTAGGAAAGLVAGLAAAGVGAIGIAIHFADTAARLNELSQATGISVEQLSLLGDVAATKGIGIDQMAKALERMDKNALAAAQSGPKTANAFKDLGIAVTNADGSLRSASDIFNNVSVKFAAMPDGPLKTAEALKIFGRAGAELIPLLNEGGAKIADLEGHFTRLNAVITGPTAAAAEQLKENEGLMGAAFTGIENQLTANLVPALNEVAKEFIDAFEGGQDNIKGLVAAIADVAKVLLNLGQLLGLLGKIIVDLVTAGIEGFQQLGEVIRLTAGAMLNALHGDWKGAWQGLQEAGIGTWNRIGDNAKLIVNDIKTSVESISNVWSAALPTAKKPQGPQPAANANPDTSFIDKQVQALQQQALRKGELAEAIGKATTSQIEANATAEATVAIQKLVDEATEKGIQKTAAFKSALAAAVPQIQAAALWMATFKAAISDQTDLDTFNKKITEQIAALEGEGQAGSVVERQWAKNNAALKPLQDNLAQLGQQLSINRALYGDLSPKVQELTAIYNRQVAELAQAAAETKQLNAAVAAGAGRAELQQQDAKLVALRATTQALMQGGEAYAKVAEQVAEYAAKTGAADANVQKFKADLIAENVQLQQQAAAKLASPGTSEQAQNLQIQISYLRQIEAEWQAQGKDITGVQQALATVNAQYQELLAKTGGFAQGATAAFAGFAKSVQSDGQLMQQEIGTALNGISNNFAEMVSGGKAKWADLVNSMEQMLLKSAIQTILNSLFKSIGQALGGGSNSGGGGILSGLGSIFGGGHADGGDVTPGKAYLVGEKGPELLKIGAAGGSIIPNGQFGGGGSGGQVTVVQNIQTPDADGFKRSAGQLHAQAYRSASQKFSRFGQ